MSKLCFVSALLFLATLPTHAVPLDLGDRLELFVDDYLIDSLDNITQRLHEPTLAGKVLAFDQPWEGRYAGYVTMLHEDGVYRCYYRGLPQAKADGSNLETTCYAESDDGIHWRKPKLGIHTVNGSTDNNVILADAAPYSHNFAPFIDKRPGVPEDQRFKALAGTSKTGLVGFISADGLRWQKLRDEPLITEGAFDSQNIAFWSESEEQYVAYFRTWHEGGYKGYRTISRATSPDFLEWSEPVYMDFGDTPMEHLYTNQTHPYYRAPHLYLAIAARFMPGRRVVSVDGAEAAGVEAQYSGDCSDSVFLTSRGGNRYDRTFMEGYIRPGIGPDHWTSRTNYPAQYVLPTGDEMSLYVQRDYGQTSAHLVRYTLRPDGFVSLHAPYQGGTATTKPLTFTGNQLLINFSTSAAGSLRIELQDKDGAPLPGFTLEDCPEIVGNEIAHPVTWKESTLESLAGQTIRLHIEMKDADLYSIQFTD